MADVEGFASCWERVDRGKTASSDGVPRSFFGYSQDAGGLGVVMHCTKLGIQEQDPNARRLQLAAYRVTHGSDPFKTGHGST